VYYGKVLFVIHTVEEGNQMEPFGSETDVIELLMRVLCDTEAPGITDAAYLFGQTAQNEDSVLEKGARLIRDGGTARLMFLGGEARSGYPGFDAWHEQLLAQGITAGKLEPSHLPPDTLAHTQTEAIAFIERAQQEGWQSIHIVSPPFHLLRAFLDTVTRVVRTYPTLRVYSVVGVPLPWTAQTVHSQGMLTAVRAALISSELERIARYHRKGDLVTATEALNYLNGRDGAC